MTAPSPKQQLRRQIGDVGALCTLTDSEADTLSRLIERVRRHRGKAFDRALDDALTALPWPLRGPAKKILFGKG